MFYSFKKTGIFGRKKDDKYPKVKTARQDQSYFGKLLFFSFLKIVSGSFEVLKFWLIYNREPEKGGKKIQMMVLIN